jgi:hypothetical protein
MEVFELKDKVNRFIGMSWNLTPDEINQQKEKLIKLITWELISLEKLTTKDNKKQENLRILRGLIDLLENS